MNQQIKEQVAKAVKVLREGGIILYPTDTIWGLGCDATNEQAVQKIYALKQRADSKAMLVLLDDVGKIASYCSMPDIAYDLLEAIVSPTTIIYPEARNLAPSMICEEKTIGIRITNEEFSKELLRQFRKPVVSTSANISGEPSPRFFSEISEQIKGGVDYIVEFRQEDKTEHKPSAIIKLGMGGEIQILRK